MASSNPFGACTPFGVTAKPFGSFPFGQAGGSPFASGTATGVFVSKQPAGFGASASKPAFRSSSPSFGIGAPVLGKKRAGAFGGFGTTAAPERSCRLGALRALYYTHSFTGSSQLKALSCRDVVGRERVAVTRNESTRWKNGALPGTFWKPSVAGGRRSIDRHSLAARRYLVRAQAGPSSESESKQKWEKRSSPVDPETGIDADGYVRASLPEEFLELMKDEGDPPNYGLIAFGVIVAVLARGIIWREVQNWINLAILVVVVAVESVQAIAYKTLEWGGQPLESVLDVFWFLAQNVVNFFRIAGDAISVQPVAFAIFLSTLVLLVGESVSETYEESPKFPSRNVLDFAGVLGLAAVVGLISAEFMLLALVGLTSYLLGAKKYNPVAGFAPAVATIVAVAGPAIRWPVFAAFMGFSVFRYWKRGYLSKGAVMNIRRGDYPRVLVGLVYLVGISMVSKVVFAFEAFFPTSPPPIGE